VWYNLLGFRGRLSPGGLRGLQIRWGALECLWWVRLPCAPAKVQCEPSFLMQNSLITGAAGYFFSIQVFHESYSILAAGLKHVPHLS